MELRGGHVVGNDDSSQGTRSSGGANDGDGMRRRSQRHSGPGLRSGAARRASDQAPSDGGGVISAEFAARIVEEAVMKYREDFAGKASPSDSKVGSYEIGDDDGGDDNDGDGDEDEDYDDKDEDEANDDGKYTAPKSPAPELFAMLRERRRKEEEARHAAIHVRKTSPHDASSCGASSDDRSDKEGHANQQKNSAPVLCHVTRKDDSEVSDANSDGDAESVPESDHSSDAVRSKRKRRSDKQPPVLTNVEVEPPAVWHANWASWFTYLEGYTSRTMQVLPIQEVLSREARNARLKKQKKALLGTVDLVPVSCDPYQRVFICTHGWVRRKSRCTGSRKRLHIRLTDCPFKFTVQWVHRGDGWMLKVKNGLFRHNHVVSAETFGTYPTSRGVNDARVEARVDGMLAVGAKRSKIYDYLLENSQNVIQSDVDNMVRQHESRVSEKEDDEATAAEVAAFAAADAANVMSVDESAKGETGVISLTSGHMREVYKRFSEMLMVDCTHKTNRHNYQLCTLMAMNEFGEGVAVQHSLIESNSDWHMDRVLTHFKRANPEGTKMLRVIIVDKDMNEVRILQSHFPEARVLICHFHVVKYMKEMRSKPEFGKVSADDASQVDAAVHRMVYARTASEYNAGFKSLEEMCKRMDIVGFFEYFKRNWHSCQEMWVLHRRSQLPHYRNHTNNRLESFFGKLKDDVSSDHSMAACVRALVAADRREQREYKYRLLRVGRYVNAAYDEEMSQVLRLTTHYASAQLEPQYAMGLSNSETYRYKEVQGEDVVIVNGARNSHRLHVNDWRCDCEFAVTMRLPCRHAIAYRKHVGGYKLIIPFDRIDERWTNSATTLKSVRQFEYSRFSVTAESTKRKKSRSHAERYKEAVRATSLIASELADIDDGDEFDQMLNFILQQWRNARCKKRTAICKGADTSESSGAQAKAAISAQFDHDHLESVTQYAASNASQLVHPPPSSSTARVEAAGDEQNKRVQLNVNASSNAARGKAFGGCDDSDNNASSDDGARHVDYNHGVKIKINPKAPKVGRPAKKRNTTAADERTNRVWYSVCEAGRQIAGEVTLVGLLDSMDKEKPGLEETQRRLSGVHVKFASADSKRPKFKRQKNPVLNVDAFYVLPTNLLRACLRVLPVKNTADDVVALDGTDGSQMSNTVDVVSIKDVGSFSRLQIETFQRVVVLKEHVRLGMEMHKWMLQTVVPAFPVYLHAKVTETASNILRTYPYDFIPGLLKVPENCISTLYRAAPPTWLTDGCIRALCDRLAHDVPSARFAGIVTQKGFGARSSPKTRSDASGVAPLPSSVTDVVKKMSKINEVQTVMVPVNFDDAHWCCIVVKKDTKSIYCYDPLNQRSYMRALVRFGTNFQQLCLRTFDVVELNTPIQFDVFSCGVFVCWAFIRYVVAGAVEDMSAGTQLTMRRYELFHYVLTGELLETATPRVVKSPAAGTSAPTGVRKKGPGLLTNADIAATTSTIKQSMTKSKAKQ